MVNEPWATRVPEQVRVLLANLEGQPERRRELTLRQACPFRAGTPLCRAWWRELNKQRLARSVARLEGE